jgi:hypothetical protein
MVLESSVFWEIMSCSPLKLTLYMAVSFVVALARAVILGSESRETRDYILLSQIRDLFYSPPTTSRAKVEVFDPASTQDCF